MIPVSNIWVILPKIVFRYNTTSQPNGLVDRDERVSHVRPFTRLLAGKNPLLKRYERSHIYY
jgi:hypothetical protein